LRGNQRTTPNKISAPKSRFDIAVSQCPTLLEPSGAPSDRCNLFDRREEVMNFGRADAENSAAIRIDVDALAPAK
jgi:hypothetical protein